MLIFGVPMNYKMKASRSGPCFDIKSCVFWLPGKMIGVDEKPACWLSIKRTLKTCHLLSILAAKYLLVKLKNDDILCQKRNCCFFPIVGPCGKYKVMSLRKRQKCFRVYDSKRNY